MMDFDARASTYDNARREERAGMIAGEIASRIGADGAKAAMEYGCGTGVVGLKLIERFDTLLFMDASQGMIGQVNKKLAALRDEKRGAARGAWAVCGDLLHWQAGDTAPFAPPLHGLRFDYIFSSMALHHIRDTTGILRKFYALLGDGGRLLIVDLDADTGAFHANHPNFDGHNGFAHDRLAKLCAQAGFERTTIQTFYRGEKPVPDGGPVIPYSLFILQADK